MTVSQHRRCQATRTATSGPARRGLTSGATGRRGPRIGYSPAASSASASARAATRPASIFAAAATAIGRSDATPYFLRHTYASLRLAEQRRSLQEIAEEMGHTVEVLARTYAHVIAEYRGQGPHRPRGTHQEGEGQVQNAPKPPQAPLPTAGTSEADGGTRTPDPIITSDVLYQLSYVGELGDGSDRSGA
jgi:hypothetical protein